MRCRAFRGSRGGGLCSRCDAVVEARSRGRRRRAAEAGAELGALLRETFRAFGGSRRRRRRLPPPPTADDRRTGRELLAARLAECGKAAFDVRGDGACQFRAVAYGLWASEAHHGLVRRRALGVLTQSPPPVHDCEVYVSGQGDGVGTRDVGDDVDAYVAALADDRAWGDSNTLQAAADAFRCRIYCVTTHKDNYHLVIEPTNHAAASEIWVGFHSEMHYVAGLDA